MSIKKIISSTKKRSKKKDKISLIELGFAAGAVVAAEEKDTDDIDIVLYGFCGMFVARAFEIIFPKTANAINSLLGSVLI